MVAAAPLNQQALKVHWSLGRLADGNEETQVENAEYLASIPSSTDNATALREQGVVPTVLSLLKARRWNGAASPVPYLLAVTLNNILTRDEAACGQARSHEGAAILGATLDESSVAAVEGHPSAEAASLQLAQALTTVAEVHADSQAAASKAGGIAATVRLMAGPAPVRRTALELLQELLPALQASEGGADTTVFDVFAKETLAGLTQLHAMMSEHSRAFGPSHVPEEKMLCSMLSQVVAHPACGEELLGEMLPHVMSCIAVFVHCSRGRCRRFPLEIEQALSSTVLAIAGRDKLAAVLRGSQQDFELLRSYQTLLTAPPATAAIRQALAQLQSLVTAL